VVCVRAGKERPIEKREVEMEREGGVLRTVEYKTRTEKKVIICLAEKSTRHCAVIGKYGGKAMADGNVLAVCWLWLAKWHGKDVSNGQRWVLSE
jgi:hypothetical protein